MVTSAAVQPTGVLFDVVLLGHVAAAVVALGTSVTSGVAAGRLLVADVRSLSPGVARYFAPGTNWAGRTIHAVPLLGLALIGLSRGAYGLDDAWVLAGTGLWVVAAVLAEGILWPAERRVQGALPLVVGDTTAGVGPVAAACRRMCWSAGGVAALLVTAMVVMVARP